MVGGTAKASSEGKVSDVSQKIPVTVGQVNKSICKGGKTRRKCPYKPASTMLHMLIGKNFQ